MKQFHRKYLNFIDLVDQVWPECRQYPDLFFPEDFYENGNKTRNSGQAQQIAKETCNRCPIQRQCLEYAIEAQEPHGIWGGTTPYERLKV